MKNYLKVKKNSKGITHIKINDDYNLGGMNYFNGNVEQRGYYLYAKAVTLENRGNYTSEISTMFNNGYKHLLKAVTRKSTKAENESREIAKAVVNDLVNAVLKQQNLELEENEKITLQGE